MILYVDYRLISSFRQGKLWIDRVRILRCAQNDKGIQEIATPICKLTCNDNKDKLKDRTKKAASRRMPPLL